MPHFDNRTAIVTGANSGMGLETARLLAESGARVIAVDMGRSNMEPLAARFGDRFIVKTVDLVEPGAAREVVSAAGGKVDVLANVAGIMDRHIPVSEIEDDAWARVIAVNLTAPMRLMREVVPLMQAAGGGAIVNVASIAGLSGGVAGGAYTASKHGLIGLTRHAAVVYNKDNIRVNAVAPGAVATPLDGSHGSDLSRERVGRLQEAIMSHLPEVFAMADVLARQIIWMVSDDARGITGIVLTSDNGWSAI